MVEAYEKSYSLPHRVGDYEIRRLLGYGATGAVYEGRHAALGRRAAIKLLHPHLVQSAVATRRFVREGRAVSRIAHPNVVEVLDVGEQDGVPYLVMSLVEGEDLRAHLNRRGFLSVAEVADCLLPVIDAVAAAHEAGIIHRDLKPSNIRLMRGPRGMLVPKVLDFGISKVVDEDSTELTETDVAIGTTSYMAPEQLRSSKHVDVRCDVYSLGVLLYECLTGSRPFRGASTYSLMTAVLTAHVARPSEVRPSIPPALDDVVLRAMRRDPEERYASMRDLARALTPIVSTSAAHDDVVDAAITDVDVDGSSSRTSLSRLTFTVLSLSEASKRRSPLRANRWLLGAGAIGIAAMVAVAASQGGRAPSSTPSVAAPSPPGAPTLFGSAPPSLPSLAVRSASLEGEESGHLSPTPATVGGPGVAPAVPIEPERGRPPSIRPAPRPAPSANRPAQLGTNGAPILE